MTLQKLLSSLLFTCLLSSCAGSAPGSSPQPSAAPDNQESTEQAKIENIEIKMNQVFHSTDIQVDYSELEKRGFAFGDSLTLTFSNGTVIDDLPYYNGYYAKIGNPVAVYYPGLYGLNFALNLGRSTWETYGFQEGDSVTIELREKGKYKNEQETFAQTHSDDLKDYTSPERFANFRALAGGSLLPDFVYRSATMTSSSMNRAAVVDDLAEKYGVKAVIDLSDTQEDLQKYRGESTWSSDYFDKLEESGTVKLVGLGVNPASEEFHKDLSEALYWLTRQEGPYLIFCMEGKDRTGYASSLIEALCGADYDDLLSDYIKTYEYYYDMTETAKPDQRRAAIETSFDPIMEIMFEMKPGEDLKTLGYAERARLFLQKGGLCDEQIDEMVRVFTGKQ